MQESSKQYDTVVGAYQEIEAIYGIGDDAKQGKITDSVLHLQKEIVQKRVDGRVGQHKNGDVDQPRQGKTDGGDAQEQQKEIPAT